jgi:hypothetical protein
MLRTGTGSEIMPRIAVRMVGNDLVDAADADRHSSYLQAGQRLAAAQRVTRNRAACQSALAAKSGPSQQLRATGVASVISTASSPDRPPAVEIGMPTPRSQD